MRRSIQNLIVLAVLMSIGYAGTRALRFTVDILNPIFACVVCVLPFFAIRPLRAFPKWARVLGRVFLYPVLLLSALDLLGALGGWELTRPVQTLQQGSSTIKLDDYDYGGGVGVHGLRLQQRRLLVPGVYLVKTLDFFDDAREGAISVEGPDKIRAHSKGNYSSDDYEVDRVYSLKPWVYF